MPFLSNNFVVGAVKTCCRHCAASSSALSLLCCASIMVVLLLLLCSSITAIDPCVGPCRKLNCGSLNESFTCEELSGLGCNCIGCCRVTLGSPSLPPPLTKPPHTPLPPSPPPVLSQQHRRAATQGVTYAELRQQLTAATPGSSLAFVLAPGEVLEIEESLVIANISVSISSPSPGATISRAAWANNSRIFHVRDAGHLSLSRVSIANGTTNGENGAGVLVEGESSILTAEFLVVSDCQVLDVGGSTRYLTHRGGGIAAIAGAKLQLRGVRVENCHANHGGGIALYGSSGVLTDCHIRECALNLAEHGTSGAGLSLTFRSTVHWFGGSIENCSIMDGGAGGGWSIDDSTLYMTNAVLHGCTAPHAGAGYVASRYYGDPNGIALANLTNVSASGW